MNKKIIAIGVVCLFLFAGLTTVSASTTVTSQKNEANGLTSDTADEYGHLHVYVKVRLIGYTADFGSAEAVNETGYIFHPQYLSYPGTRPVCDFGDIPVGTYTVGVYCELSFIPKEKKSVVTINKGETTDVTFNFGILINSKSTQPTFLSLLERFPNAFPLLRHLLDL